MSIVISFASGSESSWPYL